MCRQLAIVQQNLIYLIFMKDESSATVDKEMSKQLHGIAKLLYLATHMRPDILYLMRYNFTDESISAFNCSGFEHFFGYI